MIARSSLFASAGCAFASGAPACAQISSTIPANAAVTTAITVTISGLSFGATDQTPSSYSSGQAALCVRPNSSFPSLSLSLSLSLAVTLTITVRSAGRLLGHLPPRSLRMPMYPQRMLNESCCGFKWSPQQRRMRSHTTVSTLPSCRYDEFGSLVKSSETVCRATLVHAECSTRCVLGLSVQLDAERRVFRDDQRPQLRVL